VPVAINSYAVSGTAFVLVGTGVDGALEILGYTEQGVTLDITEFKTEIKTDLYGSETPQDFQAMGLIAKVSAPLIAIDTDVLASISTRGDNAFVGEMATPGLVLGINGFAFPLAITTVFDPGGPFYFFSALLTAQQVRRATKANPFLCEFVCWPYAPFTAVTGLDVPLYVRALP
jgi:hypothetical protein